MGRISGVATDVFLCLFGIFAALYAISPKESVGLPYRPVLSISWDAQSAEECVFHVALEIDGTPVKLPLTDPARARFGSGTCKWDAIVEGISISAASIRALVITPLLKGCAKVKLSQVEENACTESGGSITTASQEVDLTSGG